MSLAKLAQRLFQKTIKTRNLCMQCSVVGMLIFVRSVYARCLEFQVLLSSFLSWTPFTTHLNVMKGGQRKSLNHRKPITTIDHLHDNSPITTDINDSPIATDSYKRLANHDHLRTHQNVVLANGMRTHL